MSPRREKEALLDRERGAAGATYAHGHVAALWGQQHQQVRVHVTSHGLSLGGEGVCQSEEIECMTGGTRARAPSGRVSAAWRRAHLLRVGQRAADPLVVVEVAAGLRHNLAKGAVKARVAGEKQHDAILCGHLTARSRAGGVGGWGGDE